MVLAPLNGRYKKATIPKRIGIRESVSKFGRFTLVKLPVLSPTARKK